MDSYNKPLPIKDPLTQPYWDHALNGKLSVQCCNKCKHLHFPPSPLCSSCLSEDLDWMVVDGEASLVSWVRFHRAYWDGFKDSLPYDVCLVKLKEGPMILSNFSGPVPENIRAGMPMQAVFEPVTKDVALVRFEFS